MFRPPNRQNNVLTTQLAGITLIKPGVRWDKIQEVMVQVMVEGFVELGILKGNVKKLIEDIPHGEGLNNVF